MELFRGLLGEKRGVGVGSTVRVVGERRLV
jgi:hypothetical protein